VERSVPASPISRVFNFARIGSSLATNALSGVVKSGFSGSVKDHALSDDNVEVLTEGLLKMRGAALKLG